MSKVQLRQQRGRYCVPLDKVPWVPSQKPDEQRRWIQLKSCLLCRRHFRFCNYLISPYEQLVYFFGAGHMQNLLHYPEWIIMVVATSPLRTCRASLWSVGAATSLVKEGETSGTRDRPRHSVRTCRPTVFIGDEKFQLGNLLLKGTVKCKNVRAAG